MLKYVTTTLPYINGSPHVGHALELSQADMYVRILRLRGFNVFFNTGTDEHGTKVSQVAKEERLSNEEFALKKTNEFKSLFDNLNISYSNFIRTSSEDNRRAVEKFWNIVNENGDIYKKKHSGLYCVGCELFIKESEAIDNKCPIHDKELQEVEEDNYFFKLSKYNDDLKKYHSNSIVFPEKRNRELKSFLSNDLEDLSISRPKSRLDWGIEVPGDDSQVIYVWFDALINYIATLGWPSIKKNWKYWPGVQFAGKDNLRQQSIMWQGMLLSAGIEKSKKIFIHGTIVDGEGKKMSKSIGNVIDPVEIINKYSSDVLRYILLRYVHPFEDTKLSFDIIKNEYDSHLKDGLGNLVSRIMKMSSDNLDTIEGLEEEYVIPNEFIDLETNFDFNKVCDYIWGKIKELDIYIQNEQPFKIIKEDKEKGEEQIEYLVKELDKIRYLLSPIMPETSEKIKELIRNNSIATPLFPSI